MAERPHARAHFTVGEAEDDGHADEQTPPRARSPNRANGHEKAEVDAEKRSPARANGQADGEGTPLGAAKPSTSASSASKPRSRSQRFLDGLPAGLDWAKPHLFRWASWKPVIRASIAGWACLILLLVDRTREAIGQAPYLLLIVCFIAPSVGAVAPVVAYIELVTWMLSLMGLIFAYGAFWIWIAWLARGSSRVDEATFTAEAARRAMANGARTATDIAFATQDAVYHGVYLECGGQADGTS